jgi:endonuclease YncB( thermonuclease family)
VAASVTDGRTFVLADGREIRLAGIEVPAPEGATAALAAKEALAALVAGRDIGLAQRTPATDRYGRLLAFVTREGLPHSIQRELVARGYARAAPEAGPCAAELLAAERAARRARLGLWAEPDYALQRAETPAAVLAEKGRFTLVQGKVVSVRESGGTIYVNFGRRWSEDFTVTILKRNERMFVAAGLEPKKLAGRLVEVRGFIEERGGPWIEATRPEQITIVAGE